MIHNDDVSDKMPPLPGPDALVDCAQGFMECWGRTKAHAYARAYAAAKVAVERARCLRILRGVNNSDNPMTANDCADLIASGRECF